MDWQWDDPLRNLAPIPEHPAKTSASLTSELTVITDEELGNLKVNVLLDKFGQQSARHNRVASILGCVFQYLEDEGRKILAMEIREFLGNENQMFQFADHLVQAILLPCRLTCRLPSPYFPFLLALFDAYAL